MRKYKGKQEIGRVGSTPGGSFPSLSSRQSSESNKMILYVFLIGKVRVLKFEDTFLKRIVEDSI